MPVPSGVPSPKLTLVSAHPAAARVRFGPFELDLGTGELWRDGGSVRLQQQPARVLCILVQHSGRLVTREELRRHLWGDEVFVDFQRGLNFCIMQIRAALEDDAETPRFVETLPRRGYRFVAASEPVGQPSGSPGHALLSASERPRSRWRRFALRATVLAAVALAGAVGWVRAGRVGAGARELPATVRVAVLPFLQLGPSQGLPVADGLTEETIAEAGRLAPGQLAVIARSSVERYSTRPVDLARVSRELGVDFILEGSVRCETGRARVTARLVRASDQSQVWAETYERPLDDLLDLQREIARAAAGGIGITLHAGPPSPASVRNQNAGAWRLCLLGRRAFEQRTEEGLQQALRHFEAAIAAAPDYAPAHAGLADVLVALIDLGEIPPVTGLARAEAQARRALDLDPALDAAHVSLGGVTWMKGRDLPAARRQLERALALNPTNSLARKWYCGVLHDLGHGAAGLDQARIAALGDPLSVSVVYNLGAHLLVSGHTEEALGVAKQLLEIDGDAMLAHLLHGRVLGRLGRTDEAIAAYRRAHRIDPGALLPLQEVTLVQHSAGREAEARASYATLVRLLRSKPYMNATVAAVAAVLGEREEAIRLLQAALKHRELSLQHLRTAHCFDTLRGDARFVAIEQKVAAELGFIATG